MKFKAKLKSGLNHTLMTKKKKQRVEVKISNSKCNTYKRGTLFTMGLFDGDPICRFCGMDTETVQRIICCRKALAHQRYNVFGRLTVKPKDISTASIRDLCLFIRGAGLLRLC